MSFLFLFVFCILGTVVPPYKYSALFLEVKKFQILVKNGK